MPTKSGTDKYANAATITLTESAANTLTYKKLETGIALFEKVAWLIARIEYFFAFAITDFNGAGDTLGVALCTTNIRTSILTTSAFSDPAIIDLISISRYDLGAAASGFLYEKPFVKDFSTLPGGGLLIPPSPLFGAIEGTGLAAATTTLVKLWYTLVELTPDDYWELVESRRMVSS